MNLLTSINLIANTIIAVSTTLFVISVFGRADHPIWENKYRAYLAKIGLCISSCGAILNIASFSTPPVTEILLNIGLSLNFGWLSWWQYSESRKSSSKQPTTKPIAKKPRKKTV